MTPLIHSTNSKCITDFGTIFGELKVFAYLNVNRLMKYHSIIIKFDVLNVFSVKFSSFIKIVVKKSNTLNLWKIDKDSPNLTFLM